MPPTLALALALGFIAWLLWREQQEATSVSGAIWIPFLWFSILGSRSVSQWLNPGPMYSGGNTFIEGSPTDRASYFFLMLCAVVVLARREIDWRTVIAENRAYVVLLLYWAVATLWADYPAVAFRKWFKGLGDPLMVLVLITDKQPASAVLSLLRRCAFVLIPLSVVFIKYFPEIGREYSDWGPAYYTGVTTNKNLLGYLLYVFGLLFVVSLMTRRTLPSVRAQRPRDVLLTLVFLGMIGWLFKMSDSKTPLVALLAASFVAALVSVTAVRRRFVPVMLALLVVGVTAQALFDVKSLVIGSAGRDQSLTGRTELWQSVLGLVDDPVVGAGFESFWLGERRAKLWAQYGFKPTQSHNGYIEVYVNLGVIGLVVLAGFMLAGVGGMLRRLPHTLSGAASREDVLLAKFHAAFLPSYLLYNYTEATFHTLNFLFLVFVLLAMQAAPSRFADAGLRRATGRIQGRPATAATARAARPRSRPGNRTEHPANLDACLEIR